jgi:phage gp36-like protein
MNYITLDDLAERPGARELAQVATKEGVRAVATDLMEATLRGADRSAWPTDQVAVADDALQRIQDAVTEAESLIDGYLAKRSYPLPLSPVPKLVTGWARDIARYLLHKDRGGKEDSDPIVRNYKDALKFLGLVAEGKFSLGAEDPITSNPNQLDVRFESAPAVFDRTSRRAY